MRHAVGPAPTGHEATCQLPADEAMLMVSGQKAKAASDEEHAKFKISTASCDWASNSLWRDNMRNVVLHGEAGSVNSGAIAKEIGEIRWACEENDPDYKKYDGGKC